MWVFLTPEHTLQSLKLNLYLCFRKKENIFWFTGEVRYSSGERLFSFETLVISSGHLYSLGGFFRIFARRRRKKFQIPDVPSLDLIRRLNLQMRQSFLMSLTSIFAAFLRVIKRFLSVCTSLYLLDMHQIVFFRFCKNFFPSLANKREPVFLRTNWIGIAQKLFVLRPNASLANKNSFKATAF